MVDKLPLAVLVIEKLVSYNVRDRNKRRKGINDAASHIAYAPIESNKTSLQQGYPLVNITEASAAAIFQWEYMTLKVDFKRVR